MHTEIACFTENLLQQVLNVVVWRRLGEQPELKQSLEIWAD